MNSKKHAAEKHTAEKHAAGKHTAADAAVEQNLAADGNEAAEAKSKPAHKREHVDHISWETLKLLKDLDKLASRSRIGFADIDEVVKAGGIATIDPGCILYDDRFVESDGGSPVVESWRMMDDGVNYSVRHMTSPGAINDKFTIYYYPGNKSNTISEHLEIRAHSGECIWIMNGDWFFV